MCVESLSSLPKMSPSSTALSAEHHRVFVNDCAIVTTHFSIHRAVNASACSPHLSLIIRDSPTRFVPTPISLWLTHNSCAHMVLSCRCMIDFLADLCLHSHSQKLCYVITQSMWEILFTFTPKGSSALGPLSKWHCLCVLYTHRNQSTAT